jgi:DNA-directed RNA polymerase specialized sigma24 family protein
MACPKEQEVADFRADYASQSDFCRVLEQELKPLYLLAFLLTANHKKAEQCFAATARQAVEEHAVFKDWVRSWIKRCIIKNALGVIDAASTTTTDDREFWDASQNIPAISNHEINSVTRLPVLERCVFVMSILERYSDGECSVLLGCSTRNVASARMRALCRLPSPAAFIPRGDMRGSPMVEIPA